MRLPVGFVLLAMALALGCGGASAESGSTAPIAEGGSRDQGALSRLSSRWPDGTSRACAITWSSPGTGWVYDGTLTMMRTGTQVVGSIDWRLVHADASMPELAAREGARGGERIEGAFDTAVGAFLLRTTWIGDPTLNGPATYRLELTDRGFRGATAGVEDGIWDGVVTCN